MWLFKHKGKMRAAFHKYQIPYNATSVRKVDGRNSKYVVTKTAKVGFLVKRR